MKKIEIKNKLYITSDLHIGHSNMCLGASKWLNKKECRNFDSINEMNQAILNNINTLVKKDDCLIIAGDIVWKSDIYDSFFNDINCENIYIVYGNHDSISLLKKCNHSSIKYQDWYLEILYKEKHICISHFPFESWNQSQRGSYMLHGHTHDSRQKDLSFVLDNPKLTMDIGIDTIDELKPYDMDYIIKIMESKKIIHE